MNPTVRKPHGERLSIYRAWCKRCGNCIGFCPRQALSSDEWGYPVMADPARCTGCGLCEMLCPDFAIRVTSPADEAEARPEPPADRPGAAALGRVSPERVAGSSPALEE